MASEGAATSGRANSCASSCQLIETSLDARVRRVGTRATSSRWYPRWAVLPIPISTMSRTRAPYPAVAQRKRCRRSTGVVVRGLDGHLDVMRVTLLQTGGGDPDHPRGLQVGDGTRSGVPHGLAQPAD